MSVLERPLAWAGKSGFTRHMVGQHASKTLCGLEVRITLRRGRSNCVRCHRIHKKNLGT